MNFRQKSKKFGKWQMFRFRPDLAVYAVCRNCGFTYKSSAYKWTEDGGWIVIPHKPSYKYCPNCGLKMSLFDTHIYDANWTDDGEIYDIVRTDKEITND